MDFFLANLGKIYQAGANFDIQKLYPKVEYPVPRGTPMLSYMFGWDHGHEWEVYTGPLKLLNCVSSFTVDPFASDSKVQAHLSCTCSTKNVHTSFSGKLRSSSRHRRSCYLSIYRIFGIGVESHLQNPLGGLQQNSSYHRKRASITCYDCNKTRYFFMRNSSFLK